MAQHGTGRLALGAGAMTRGQLITAFSESAEYRAAIENDIADGFITPDFAASIYGVTSEN